MRYCVAAKIRQFDATSRIRDSHEAGWSSLVARRAHNPKVVSSNLTPATMGAYQETPLSALLIYGYELGRNTSLSNSLSQSCSYSQYSEQLGTNRHRSPVLQRVQPRVPLPQKCVNTLLRSF